MVQAYFEQGHWPDYVASLVDLYRGRRDTMLDALAEHFPPQAEWTHPAGGMFVWATLPDFIDTTDLLARALRENVAFVPGEAAYLDGRGRNSLRLSFSACGHDEIREGIRRIGEVVTEQVELYGTLTGVRAPVAEPRPRTRARAVAARRCCRSPPPWIASSAPGASEPRGGAQGRPLARAVGVAALGRAGGGRPAPVGPHRGAHRRVHGSHAAPARRGRGRGVRGHARPRRRGRHRAGAARDRRDARTRDPGRRRAPGPPTRSWPST